MLHTPTRGLYATSNQFCKSVVYKLRPLLISKSNILADLSSPLQLPPGDKAGT